MPSSESVTLFFGCATSSPIMQACKSADGHFQCALQDR